MKIILVITSLIVFGSLQAQKLDSISYKIDGKEFMTYYAKPSVVGPRTKTVLIVHEWWGLSNYPKERALKIAEEGNIAVCVDMYGKGKIAANPTDAQALATPFYKDSKLAYDRFMAAYNVAVKIEGVDTSKIAAIGYCFGGSIVLNAAKMGAPLDLVVSFHGGLAGIPVDKTKLKAYILVCHGKADSFVSEEEVTTFKKQMDESEKPYMFINYTDAMHAFTNPHSTEIGKEFNIPIAYNEEADLQSWIDFNKWMRKVVF